MSHFDLEQLADRARSLVPSSGRAILGIVGAPGAGKTTLVRQLLTHLTANPPVALEPQRWVAHVPMDGFHLADVQLDRLGLRARKGAPETFDARGYAALLARLRVEGQVYAPGFERDIEQPIAAAIEIPDAARLVVTEGNYLLLEQDPWPLVRAQLDEVWFLDLDEDTRLRRLVARHIEFGKPPADALDWARGTDQANAVRILATRGRADLVIPATIVQRQE